MSSESELAWYNRWVFRLDYNVVRKFDSLFWEGTEFYSGGQIGQDVEPIIVAFFTSVSLPPSINGRLLNLIGLCFV